LIYSVDVETDPADLLRQRGIQVTAQRLAVLRAVAGQPHITADGVAEVVRAEIGAISLQSVYDALGLLVEQGLVRRIQPAGSPARFEDRVGDNHLVDVDCMVGSAPCLSAVDEQGYEIDEAEVAYWGRCPECLAKAGAASRSNQASRSDPSSPRPRRPGRRARAKGPTNPTTHRGKKPRH
jgi:Fur family ferric uptake transcriptional regulator